MGSGSSSARGAGAEACEAPLSPEAPVKTTNNKQHHVRQASIRHIKQPMPDPSELERRFTKVLVSTVYYNARIHCHARFDCFYHLLLVTTAYCFHITFTVTPGNRLFIVHHRSYIKFYSKYLPVSNTRRVELK